MTNFADRPASQAWEQVSLPGMPGYAVWAWFKPAQFPQDVVLRIPDQTWHACGGRLTMRQLLGAVQITAEEVQLWMVQGLTFDPQGGANPLLDQPVPPPVSWLDNSITVRVDGRMPAMAAPALPGPAAASTTTRSDQLLAAMDADWNSILQFETTLGQVRKQLNTLQGRLQSLNRDLSPDERLAADSNDVKDWQDARRFLRDASANVSRYIRDHDIGVTSAAGQRTRFEEIHQRYVVPRKPFEGLEAVQHDFEVYRKVVQSLVGKMQTALSNAGRDGEQRAQQVLSRIGAKMRKSRQKRGT